MRTAACGAAVWLLASSTQAQIVFQVLPLPVPLRNGNAVGVSAVGSVVVGTGNGPPGTNILGFAWSPKGGPVLVPLLPGFPLVSADGVSGDGRTIVGSNFSADIQVRVPFVWTRGLAPVALPFLPGHNNAGAREISRDGGTVVGASWLSPDPQSSSGRAVLWREGTVTSLGVPQGWPQSSAEGVSGDGSVVVGMVQSYPPLREAAFRWTAQGGMEVLPHLTPDGRSYASGVSDDGTVVVGSSRLPGTTHAVRWRVGRPPQDLGAAPGLGYSNASAASADGRIVVGDYASGPTRAFVYTDQTGMVDLAAFLVQRGVDLHGVTLESCSGVNPSGDELVGWGRSYPPTSDTISWRLSLPGVFCYANCDASAAPPVLNVSDFVCFLNKYVLGSEYANCDGSTAAPVLGVSDFVCFQQKFAAGCP